MKEYYPEKGSGKTSIAILKASRQKHRSWLLFCNEEKGLEQFQKESFQPIQRLKDKKRKINFNYCFIVLIRCCRWNFKANLKLSVKLQILVSIFHVIYGPCYVAMNLALCEIKQVKHVILFDVSEMKHITTCFKSHGAKSRMWPIFRQELGVYFVWLHSTYSSELRLITVVLPNVKLSLILLYQLMHLFIQ